MRTRKLVAAVGLAVVVAVGAFVLWPRQDRITRENYGRIQPGMPRAEVEAILGPPGDYTTRRNRYHGQYWRPDGLKSYGVGFYWMDDTGLIVLYFSHQTNDVGGMEFEDIGPDARIEASPFETLRWRVERRWRKWFR
jgi:hypothetical protein